MIMIIMIMILLLLLLLLIIIIIIMTMMIMIIIVILVIVIIVIQITALHAAEPAAQVVQHIHGLHRDFANTQAHSAWLQQFQQAYIHYYMYISIYTYTHYYIYIYISRYTYIYIYIYIYIHKAPEAWGVVHELLSSSSDEVVQFTRYVSVYYYVHAY